MGTSWMSRHYAISSLAEARAYVEHPVLGPRLIACASLVLGSLTTNPEDIFPPVDAKKLRSSMTLFHRAAPGEPVFSAVLDRFFAGGPDPATDDILSSREGR